MIMKQRLLYALLLLFGALGVAQINAQTIQVTSNGTKPVNVTLNKAITTPSASSDGVTLSSDKLSVTIDAGHTAAVTIKSTNEATSITVSGNLDDLDIDAPTVTSLTFEKENLVKKLTLKAPELTSLTCSGLGMEELNLTGSNKLTSLTASDNKLANTKVTLPNPTPNVLTTVDLSKNKLSVLPGGLDKVQTLNLEENLFTAALDVSGYAALNNLYLNGNEILKGLTVAAPANCTVSYGQYQRISMSAIAPAPANLGFRVTKLLEKAGIVKSTDTYTWSAKWFVKDNDKVYQPDNGQTAQPQSASDAYKDEYRFYDKDTKIYLAADEKFYQAEVSLSGLKDAKITTYQLYDLKVTPAEFRLSWENPSHTVSPSMTVKVDDTQISKGDIVKQGQILTINVSPDTDNGYVTAVYEIAGLRPSDGSAQAPYKGTSLTCVVEGKYISVDKSEEPKVVATVLGAEHKVEFENLVQEGGNFTVHKISGGETIALTPGDVINTGDKLVVTLKPATGYDYYLKVNQQDKTSAVDTDTKVFEQEITQSVYPDETPIAIAVTFGNQKVDANALVDGKAIASTTDYLYDKKISVTRNGSGNTPQELSITTTEIQVLPNTSYQAKFTLIKDADGELRRLKDLTINGGELVSLVSQEKSIGGLVNGMEYTVNFKTFASAVTLSITTKTVTAVAVAGVKNLTTAQPIPDSSDKYEQEQVYDGNAKPVMFTTDPANLNQYVKITYESAPSGQTYGVAPANAGYYKAVISFQETDNYVPAPQGALNDPYGTATVYYRIAPASLTITKLPTVTVDKNNKYVVEGGEAKFGSDVIKGKFKTVYTGSDNDKSAPEGTNEIGKSHIVCVKFVAESEADQKNFVSTKTQVQVIQNGQALTQVKVTKVTLPEGYSISWFNGDQPVNIASDKFAAGTKLTAKVAYPKGSKDVTLDKVSQNGTSVITTVSTADGLNIYTVELKEDTELKVTGTADTYTVKFQAEEVDFDGTPKTYDYVNKVTILDKAQNKVNWNGATMTITYKENGQVISNPVHAGTYTVVVTIKPGEDAGYLEKTYESNAFTINKVEPLVYNWPSASVIAKGMPLSQSELTEGSAAIPGTFSWKEPNYVHELAGEFQHVVLFTPASTHARDYKVIESPVGTSESGVHFDRRPKVIVSDLQVVSFVQTNGTVVVRNQNGKELPTGTAIAKGDKLTIVATPNAGYKLESLKVNGAAFSSGSTLTVGDQSVSIQAQFSANSTYAVVTFAPVNGTITVRDNNGRQYASGDQVLEGTQLIVSATPAAGYKFKSLTIGGKSYTENTQSIVFGTSSLAISAEFVSESGVVILSYPSVEAVAGKGFRLDMYGATSAASGTIQKMKVYGLLEDLKRVVVKAGTETIPMNEDGTYSIKADADKVISVTLANPTKIKVEVEKETKNAKGFVLGHTMVEGLAYDSTCYYGDEITLVAMPESGVTFGGWSDDRLAKDQLRTIEITRAMQIQPIFNGTPTGIESIEAAEVIGSEGCIIIRGVADARVTIVSMDGRAQQQTISGDTRISVGAGIYGVVLEQGNEVKREKVIVR